MSVHSGRRQRIDGWRLTMEVVAETMAEYKWQLSKDTLVSVLLSGLAYQALAAGFSAPASVSVVAIGLINTITAADVLEIVRQKKRVRLVETKQEAGSDD